MIQSTPGKWLDEQDIAEYTGNEETLKKIKETVIPRIYQELLPDDPLCPECGTLLFEVSWAHQTEAGFVHSESFVCSKNPAHSWEWATIYYAEVLNEWDATIDLYKRDWATNHTAYQQAHHKTLDQFNDIIQVES
jgi:hypothetical protein